ncbi:MAG: sensor histidine kinase [Sphingobacteriaceae bacterium]
MNPQAQNQNGKFLLLAFALLIAGASLWYTNYLVRNISIAERTRAEVWALSNKKILEIADVNDEFITFIYSIRDSLEVPAIVTDAKGKIIFWKGLDSTKTNIQLEADESAQNAVKTKIYDPQYFERQLEQMKSQHEPISIHVASFDEKDEQLVYYKDSVLLSRLRIFPYIQLSLIAVFLFFAYFVFNAARKSEQNQVWVGMAKETAHQLGTPISSLMAWMELLKSRFKGEKDNSLILEMENDMKRLEIVADRFSKIGSKPVLESQVVFQVVNDFVNYFKFRSSDKISFEVSGEKQAEALINIPLFDWVLENLLKNAVNAIEGSGTISIIIKESLVKEKVVIDISDSGKGIPKNKFETIFQPGYTTRKRGWGLGLSLTRRIIQNYHQGQIFVKESEPGKGTTFRIILKSSLTYEPTNS